MESAVGEDEKIDLKKSSPTTSSDLEVKSEKIVVPHSDSTGANKISASDLAVGGGTGGVFVLLAEIFVSDPHLRQLVQVISPTASLVILGIYRWISHEIAEYYLDWKQERKRLRLLGQVEAALAVSRAQLREVNADPHATSEDKAKVRGRVQRIEKTMLDLGLKGILVID
jgi:hypothetical protein